MLDEIESQTELIKSEMDDMEEILLDLERKLSEGKRISGKKILDEIRRAFADARSNVDYAADNIYGIAENKHVEEKSPAMAFASQLADNLDFIPGRLPTSLAAWQKLNEIVREWYLENL